MQAVKSYVSEKSIKKKNRLDFVFRNIFRLTAILSASIVIVVIIVIAVRGITPFIQSYTGYNNITGEVILSPVNPFKFLVKSQWLEGAVGASSDYGIGFAIINTMIAVFLSIMITVPVAVVTALLIAKVAPKKISSFLRTVVELLASIPSIIYGVIGLGVITNFVNWIGGLFNYQTAAGLSLLSTVLVLFMMTLPTITAVAETSIRAVKNDIIEGSLALAATNMQTYFKVVLSSAKSGIFAGVILGVGRALGEATAVSMVSGNSFSGVTLNPLATTSTLTSRMLLGIKETSGIDYDIRFSVGLVLMLMILITNVVLKAVMKKVGNLDEN
ncbi:MAG: phosphate ABC transporter permease subunit PstC [Acholeplasmataceae bacterium]